MQATQEVANGIAGLCHVIQDNVGGVRHIDELKHVDNFCVYYKTVLIEEI